MTPRSGREWARPESPTAPQRSRARARLVRIILVEVLAGAAILISILILTSSPARRAPAATSTADAAPLAIATQPATPTPAPAQPTRQPAISLSELPAPLLDAVRGWATRQGYELAAGSAASAELVVSWEKPSAARRLADVVLAPVAAFFAGRDDLDAGELRRAWRGRARPGDSITRLFVTPDSGQALQALWGPAGAGASVATVLPAGLSEQLWADRRAVAVIAFDRLEPDLKVLAVDGLSAVDPALSLSQYPLVVPLWAGRSDAMARALATEVEARGLQANRRADRLSVVALTGVTALTRNLALEMEARGDPAWPARGVAAVLSAADLTHISNEVSFMPGCVPRTEMTAFCAPPEYMDTLRLIGADVVELTGNHNLDFGPEYARLSLDMYEEAGMHTYGGGGDVYAARTPLLVQHHGNRLAFLGYNSYGPDYAWATADGPGAARFSLDAARADIAAARAESDLVLVGLQYTEVYSTGPLVEQIADFRAVAEAGADVVIGTQAHQPQAIEFAGQRAIFYGLGNLFFDQTWSDATRQSLIVRLAVYEGHVVAVELLPTVMDDDYQPHLATGQERDAILGAVFEESEKLRTSP